MRVFDRFRALVLRGYGHLLLGQRVEAYGLFTVANPANVAIGRNCAINHGVFILGRTRISIGDDVVLSARCMLVDGGLDPNSFSGQEVPKYAEAGGITIEDGVWVGAGAIILPGVTIGRRAVIGAGSVVTRSVGPNAIVAGNPARPLTRSSEASSVGEP